MPTVTVSVSKRIWAARGADVERVARRSLLLLKQRSAHVDFFLVTDKEMQDLNMQYRGKRSSTNILSFLTESFPRPDMPKKGNFLGEIYLAPDTIRERGDDWNLLVIHGILHCLGYTHSGKSDRIKMERREDVLISRLSSKARI